MKHFLLQQKAQFDDVVWTSNDKYFEFSICEVVWGAIYRNWSRTSRLKEHFPPLTYNFSGDFSDFSGDFCCDFKSPVWNNTYSNNRAGAPSWSRSSVFCRLTSLTYLLTATKWGWLPPTWRIATVAIDSVTSLQGVYSNRRGIASSLHGRFEIAARSRLKLPLKSQQRSPL